MGLFFEDIHTEEVVVLDFETTGLTPQYDRVIEVAAVIIKNKKITSSFSQLTNPGQFIPYFITELTGISNAMVKGKPSPEKVMPELKKFIGNRLIVAHNASFDKRFLLSEMNRVSLSIDNPIICTMVLSRKLIPDLYNYKLGTIAQHLRINVQKSHRALDDAKVTAKVWNHLYAQISDRAGIKRPDASILMNISKQAKKSLDKYFIKIRPQ